jgi:hypothetical protein
MSIDIDPRSVTRPKARKAIPPPPPDVDPATPQPPRIPGRRNPKWIALGVIALCLGALLAYAVYARVATETSLVVMTHTVYRGETIEAADLGRVVVQGDSFPRAVPSEELETLVGKHAVFDLPEGSVVTANSADEVELPRTGQAVVGLRLASGRAPVELLLPSSPIRLVALPAADSAPADTLAGKTFVARVISHAPDADGTSTLVNVEVDTGQAPTIAMLAARDRLAVVRDSGR